MKLTKSVVDRQKPRASEYLIWDDRLPGFGLRVFPTGKRSYVFQYRHHGRTRKYTIGPHGKWTPEQAWKKAVELSSRVNDGSDPSAERRAISKDIALSELCDIYLREGCDSKKASTLATDRGRIERHIKPLIGNLRVKSITRQDTKEFMEDLIAGKSAAKIKTRKRGLARVTGGKGTAARTMGLLGAIFTFAVNSELRQDNPVRGVSRPKDKKRERFLSKVELRRLGQVLDNASHLNLNLNVVPAIKLLLLTGCRKSEILSLLWREVDLEKGFLMLADSKTGARKIPLSKAAIALVEDLPRIEGNPYVFPSTSRHGHFVGLQKAWERVRTAAEIPDVRIHDLRHSYATILAEDGNSLLLIGKLLGHRDLRTTQIYAHIVDKAQRVATQGAGEKISSFWT